MDGVGWKLHAILFSSKFKKLSVFNNNLKVPMASTTIVLPSLAKINLLASLGCRLYMQSCIHTLIWVVISKSINQVCLSTEAKLTSEQTKVRSIPLFTCHLAYLGHSFFLCPAFSQKKQVNSSSCFFCTLCCGPNCSFLSSFPFLVLRGGC